MACLLYNSGRAGYEDLTPWRQAKKVAMINKGPKPSVCHLSMLMD
jgi:hypothetical protein